MCDFVEKFNHVPHAGTIGTNSATMTTFWSFGVCVFVDKRKTIYRKQVRLVSAKAERPNHPSRGGGSASQGGFLHNNDTDMTP